jgi:NAD(P)-dependent dehydrogenase (short-subunit alcohol dehydrogenase family)
VKKEDLMITGSPYASLKNRTIIVTGGGQGLGREMALALVEHGANVVITSVSDHHNRARTEKDAQALEGGGILALQADVSNTDDCQQVVHQAVERFGAVHGLINNAGRGMRLISETFNKIPTRFWEADDVAWKQIIDININGTFLMSKAVMPKFLEQDFGRIINISTSDVTMVRQGYSPYGPSKTAVEACSVAWAAELIDTAITVNVLLPGGASNTALLPDSIDKKGADGNLLPPDIMRIPALWLCSDLSNNITGRRLIARNWDTTLTPDEAAAGAMEPVTDKPRIM